MSVPLFLLNLTLTGVWLVLTEDASFFQIIIGFLIGAVITHVVGVGINQPGYLRGLGTRFRFLGYFLTILVKANIEVAREILTPGFSMKPRLMRYDVSDLDAIQVTTFANAITLTPGTLSADISEDGRTLYIHAMYAQTPEAVVAALDELRDRLIQDVFES